MSDNNVVVIENRPPATAMSPTELMARAIDNNVSAEMLNKLTDWRERMDRIEAEKAFNAAMARAKALLRPILKDTKAYNYNYAELATIQREVDPILAAEGLFYRWRCKQDDGSDRVTVTCVLSHVGGHSEENSLTSTPEKGSTKMTPVQALGATKTYLERYTLMGAIGLSSAKDIDGNSKNIPDNPPKTGLVPKVDIGPESDYAGGERHKDTKEPEIRHFSRSTAYMNLKAQIDELYERGAGPVELREWHDRTEKRLNTWPPDQRRTILAYAVQLINKAIDDRSHDNDDEVEETFDAETGEISAT